jgi:hypothetical protein
MIEAKPVIANRYWILKQDDQKVGTVEADSDGFQVRIHDQTQRFRTIPMARKQASIDFQPEFRTTPQPRNLVHGFDAGCRVHNAMWDVKRRLPLFTKTARSKSWYAAGWYQVQQHRRWQVLRNPKLIILDRYQFQGPFHSQEQARDQSV